MIKEILKEHLEDFLSYADDIEKVDLAMSLCCRQYYLESCIKGSKQWREIFERTEQQKQKLGLSKNQLHERANTYCNKMFKKIMANVNTPEYDIENAIGSLKVMIDFISILNTFGPLTHDWVEKSTSICEDRERVHKSAEGAVQNGRDKR
eukprot:TRINITY_DN17542_c0_g1_i2.p2 TRINITY_DN17542_c0_g1~~TRINITY_DN17542_c0_g1_i2.p2  ORF type:complete len:150 (+),score=32.83 TRINITY_DN17542_c0_g1_i2:35-484(+)